MPNEILDDKLGKYPLYIMLPSCPTTDQCEKLKSTESFPLYPYMKINKPESTITVPFTKHSKI